MRSSLKVRQRSAGDALQAEGSARCARRRRRPPSSAAASCTMLRKLTRMLSCGVRLATPVHFSKAYSKSVEGNINIFELGSGLDTLCKNQCTKGMPHLCMLWRSQTCRRLRSGCERVQKVHCGQKAVRGVPEDEGGRRVQPQPAAPCFESRPECLPAV